MVSYKNKLPIIGKSLFLATVWLISSNEADWKTTLYALACGSSICAGMISAGTGNTIFGLALIGLGFFGIIALTCINKMK